MISRKQITGIHVRSHSQSGFTLVEIMVGLAIGLLATLVVMQVFEVFEMQKRTTTGTADAQTNGTIALYSIGREMQQAGFALMPFNANQAGASPLACTQLVKDGVAANIDLLSPASIVDGVSDTITIRYGDSRAGGAPSMVRVLTGNTATLGSNLGCTAGSASLSFRENSPICNMSSVSSVPATPPADAQTIVTLRDPTGVAVNSYVSCLGAWHEVTFRVNNDSLERQDLAVSNNFVPVLPDIVNLQAQYGISSSCNSNDIVQWVDATGGQWATPSVADRNKIKAIRVAVVTRNSKMEGGNISDVCGSASGTPLCSWTGGPAIDLSANPNWKRYRYRVFETTYPLRNVVWSKGSIC